MWDQVGGDLGICERGAAGRLRWRWRRFRREEAFASGGCEATGGGVCGTFVRGVATVTGDCSAGGSGAETENGGAGDLGRSEGFETEFA